MSFEFLIARLNTCMQGSRADMAHVNEDSTNSHTALLQEEGTAGHSWHRGVLGTDALSIAGLGMPEQLSCVKWLVSSILCDRHVLCVGRVRVVRAWSIEACYC